MTKSDPSTGRLVLDTNLWIDALRDAEADRRLQSFRYLHAPGHFLSSVVAYELLAGCRSAEDRRIIDHEVLSPFVRRGRVLTPSGPVWRRAGDVMVDLRERHGSVPATRAFGNDVLIALSCREAGMTLVTDDRRDFERIAAVAPFDFVVGLSGLG